MQEKETRPAGRREFLRATGTVAAGVAAAAVLPINLSANMQGGRKSTASCEKRRYERTYRQQDCSQDPPYHYRP